MPPIANVLLPATNLFKHVEVVLDILDGAVIRQLVQQLSDILLGSVHLSYSCGNRPLIIKHITNFSKGLFANEPHGISEIQRISLNAIGGWQIDNFEGLAHHQDNRFFTVSDNNDLFVQRTLPLYFELTGQ
jgi:hypothetical protein